MEKINKTILYEYGILHNAKYDAAKNYESDSEYSEYHDIVGYLCSMLLEEIDKIVEFPSLLCDSKRKIVNESRSQQMDRFISYITKIKLSPEQISALSKVRKDPFYISVMGKAALSKKKELEELLEVTIDNRGKQFVDKYGIIEANKCVKELNDELKKCSIKLDELLESGEITDLQCERYEQYLRFIYNYYRSQSRGEQMNYRKLSNKEYERRRELFEEAVQAGSHSYTDENEEEHNIENMKVSNSVLTQEVAVLKEQWKEFNRLQEEIYNRKR